MPHRMEDGNTMLTHWTKKIIVEDGHTMQQLFHILQLVVRHYKVYYPVRHALVTHIVSSMQKLASSQNPTIDHRRIIVELAEVIIKWELQRIKDEAEDQEMLSGIKRSSTEERQMELRKAANTGWSSPSQTTVLKHDPEVSKPIERANADMVFNLLLRFACQVQV